MKRTTVGSNVQYPPFPKTVMTAHAWSVLEEIIRYLKNMEIDNKKCVLQEHLHAMARTVWKRIYSQELIVRVFQYFATTRSLHNRLRIDYQSPYIKTLTRITSKVSVLNETRFMGSVFNTLKENEKQCVIMEDEICVRKMLYHGGTLFGRATDDLQSPAKTILGVVISCLFGGPTFISKMLPIAKLNSPFLYEQIRLKLMPSVSHRV